MRCPYAVDLCIFYDSQIFFIILAIEKLGWSKILARLPKAVQHIYALFLINLSWVIFSYDSLSRLGTVLKRMFGMGGIPLWSSGTSYYVLAYLAMFLIMAVASTELPKRLIHRIGERIPVSARGTVQIIAEVAGILVVLLLSTSHLASDAFNPFLYFRF